MKQVQKPAAARGARRRFGPLELWRGYDPRREPLDEMVLREWTEDGRRQKELYFTGLTHRGVPVRVYAQYSAPRGRRRLPAVLHVHGGGQSVDPEWLEFWNRRGYAAMSLDWGGYRPWRTRYTIWNLLSQGDHVTFNDCGVKPTPRANSWYLWARVCRRALTVLERQPEVDPRRMGAFGISMGGTLLWNLAIDRRLKAGCAIYGVGWNTWRNDPRHLRGHEPRKLPPAERRWVDCLAPESYAPILKFPMLFLSATNDVHGNLDRIDGTLDAIPRGVPRARAITPRFNHHVGQQESNSLPLWMDCWLKGRGRWPANPVTRLALAPDGVPVLTVRPDPAHRVRKVEVLYALENPWAATRHWRDARVRRGAGGREWSARLPVMSAGEPLFAYAQVVYASGACVASRLEVAVPAELGAARATGRPEDVLFDGSAGLDGFLEYCRTTEPRPPIPEYMRLARGPGGRRAIAIRPGACTITYKIGDPRWRGPDGARLQFDAAAAEEDRLRVIVRGAPLWTGKREYEAAVPLPAARGWQSVALRAEDFRDAKSGEALSRWSDVHMLEIRRAAPGLAQELFLADLRWRRDGGREG